MFPEVDVRTADSRCANVHQAFVGAKLGDFAFDYLQVMFGGGVDSEVLGLLLGDGHVVRFSFVTLMLSDGVVLWEILIRSPVPRGNPRAYYRAPENFEEHRGVVVARYRSGLPPCV